MKETAINQMIKASTYELRKNTSLPLNARSILTKHGEVVYRLRSHNDSSIF